MPLIALPGDKRTDNPSRCSDDVAESPGRPRHAAKTIEIEDIDARLRELEEAAEANKSGGRR